MPRPVHHSRRVLPGFRTTTGLTGLYLTVLVVIPLGTLILSTLSFGPTEFWNVVTQPRTLAALRVSFGAALLAAAIDAPVGLLVAWVLTRYRFPGRAIIDATIDLPFALPTAVTGITLTTLYAEHGWLGAPLLTLGVKVSYTRVGIVLALAFIGLPFVVRAVQPVLAGVERDMEDAAQVLGATRWQTVARIILPTVVPAVLSGVGLAFARGIGEYGSVVFIAGNMPFRTEIAPLLIVTKLEEYDKAGAAAIALVLLLGSFLVLFAFNRAQQSLQRAG